jgi:hypothetical protein
MKQVQSKSSTGGTITEYFNNEGLRVKAVHSAGKAYSGKAAEAEQRKVDKR